MADTLQHFRQQANACRSLGSPFTAALVDALADLLAEGAPGTERLAAWAGDPNADAIALRAAAGLHGLALAQRDAGLVDAYAERGTDQLRPTVGAALITHQDWLDRFLDHPPQTNEVGRSAVLAGGFMTISAQTGLPLHLLEIGASAGLNLHWDRWRYQLGSLTYGPPEAPLCLSPNWTGPPPPGTTVTVASRCACDLKPIDLEDATARLRLRAYVWADQSDRLARLDAAIETARAAPIPVDEADALPWLTQQLREPPPAGVRVLYHSIFWQYMPSANRRAVRRLIDTTGAAATPEQPFAWLRMEPSRDRATAELRLTTWPEGEETLLAETHYHGSDVTWLA